MKVFEGQKLKLKIVVYGINQVYEIRYNKKEKEKKNNNNFNNNVNINNFNYEYNHNFNLTPNKIIKGDKLVIKLKNLISNIFQEHANGINFIE